ncbi:GxxExxY protein [Opitutus sp. GAS368]|jgi:GxxExxY protein|uniref:GxxExxY protein n=1 Tax=Opitutus sp. GAS368 TaxID=1882749 RepID=UPI00087A39BF|nr:GxxExxY protein [Opitutus sp. GAS368]SDS64326.1 GxxExxY protein [Opitutus sp. GAS368]
MKPITSLSVETESVASGAIECAFRVHRQLGPGLLESVYEACLLHELKKSGLRFESQKILPVIYDDLKLETGLRLDVVVQEQVVLELKAVEALLPIHQAQVLTYLKLTGFRLGLLINFNTVLLKDGIRRVVL